MRIHFGRYSLPPMNTRVKRVVAFWTALSLVLVFFLQGVFFIRANSPTYDEAMHLAAGYSYLATRDFRLEPQNPPLIRELLALPLYLIYRLRFRTDTQAWQDGVETLVGQDFLYQSALPADQLLVSGRLANLLIGGLLIALTAWWAYRLWGTGAALLAMALASFEPNFIAHSGLVTTDIGTSFFFFLTIYLLWEYVRSPGWWHLVGTGLSLGATLVTKFSVIVLVPLIGLILLLHVFRASEEKSTFLLRAHPHSLTIRFLDAAAAFLLILIFAVPVISVAYFFHGFRPMVLGFEQFFMLARKGQAAFFLGEYSYRGWWDYFLVAFLLKTPLGSLILIVASLLLSRAGDSLTRQQAAFLLLPVAMMFLATSQSAVDIGLRHILPIYPFLFVLASRLATLEFSRRWLAPVLIGVPLLFTAVSSVRIAPHELAYFNEIIGGPNEGYRYLADSNLDWGQDLKNLKTYMDRQKLPVIYLSYFGTAPPSYYGIRYQYVPGTWPLEWPPPDDTVPSAAPRKILAISANNLQDVFNSYGPLFRWLRLREPIAKIGYSIFVYDLTNDPVGVMMIERSYALAGLAPPSDQSFASN
jgi:dolichyl-phosphate-mannose-protein mannosyltransferase